MSLGGYLRRLVVGEQRCKVIIEVPDLGVDGWRRLSADPRLRWRRLNPGRPLAGPATLRRRRGKFEPTARPDSAAPAPALLEASGAATGTAVTARQRLAVRAMAQLSAAGLHGEVLGAAADEPGVEPVEPESVWPASDDVLIFGPADQDELDRRFALVTGAWSVPEGAAAAPSVVEPAQRRRRARVDVLAGLCVLPLLLMAVPTLGPWLDRRTWALLLAAAVVCVALPLLVVQALAHGRPALAAVRSRVLGLAAALVVLLVAARLAIRLPVPPLVVLVLAALLVAGLTPVALRLLPSSRPVRAVAVGAPVALALVAAPVGDLLDGVYLDRLGLRPTDVAVSFAQRWWSGAFFGVTALAGLVLAAVAWGWWRQLDAVGRRRTPAAALLALLGAVYAAALLALAAGVAWNQAGAAADRLPGRWGGIAPAWVCWSPAGGGAAGGGAGGASTSGGSAGSGAVGGGGAVGGSAVPFAGKGLPPTGYAVVWLGGADGQYALWSPELGGVRISDQVQLRLRDAPGRCP